MQNFLRTARLLSTMALIGGLMCQPAAAAEQPDRETPVSKETVLKIYAGKTWVWSAGGSYWAKDGSFLAIWNRKRVAVGTWHATNDGNLCYDATWHEAEHSPGDDLKRCWRHVVDSQGTLWKQDVKNQEWYMPEKEFQIRLKTGNRIKSGVNRLMKRYGL